MDSVINLDQIEEMFLQFSTYVPLELYTFFGSFIEEVIGIIPSPLVLTVAGSVALSSHKGIVYILLLGLIAALGKTLASWLLYFVADKAEDVVIGKFGKLVGVSHTSIEALGKRFGKGKRDDLTIFFARAIPIIPSSAVSVVCGAIRIDLKTYLVATYFGNYVRSMFYIYLGYSGLEQAEKILGGVDDAGSWLKMLLPVGLLAFLAWMYYKRSKMKL